MAFWTANSPQLQWHCHNDHCCRIYRPGICPYVCVYMCMYFIFLISYWHTYVHIWQTLCFIIHKAVSLSIIFALYFCCSQNGIRCFDYDVAGLNLLDLCIVQCHGLMMQWPVYIRCRWLVYLITSHDSLCRTHPHLSYTVFSVFHLQLLNLRLQL